MVKSFLERDNTWGYPYRKPNIIRLTINWEYNTKNMPWKTPYILIITTSTKLHVYWDYLTKIWLVKTFDRLWDSQDIIHLKNLWYVWHLTVFMKFQTIPSFFQPVAYWNWWLVLGFLNSPLNLSVPAIHSGSHPTSILLGSGKFLYVVKDHENKKRGMK